MAKDMKENSTVPQILGYIKVFFILLAALFGAIIMSFLFIGMLNISESDTISDSINKTYESPFLLASGSGIITSEVKVNNDTWIDCTTDDFVESERYDTISFWYMNSTVDWIFITNSSGTLYVDGVLGTPELFPVYDNGTKMFLCQTGEFTFFDGSFDDFRGYNSSIDAELVNLTYLGGRL